MQATQPVRKVNAAAAALAAIVVAVAITAALIAAGLVAPAFSPADAGSGTTTQAAPLVLDPDARDAGARRGSNLRIAQ